jgi:O-methyltransferase
MGKVTSFLRQHREAYRLLVGIHTHLLALKGRIGLTALKDANAYGPLFRPWIPDKDFAALLKTIEPHTLVSPDRCYLLYQLANQVVTLEGDFWECGVFRGGTALMFAEILAGKARAKENRALYLFDTFEGMPEAHPEKDKHKSGDLADTSVERVSSLFKGEFQPKIVAGWIPETFKGLEDRRIAFAHVDVDIYQSVVDCCAFIYPRLAKGAVMVFDDYGFPTCPGARLAVDEFFGDKPEIPMVLPTGQAFIWRQGTSR